MLFWYFTVALLILASLFVVLPLWWLDDSAGSDADVRASANVDLFEERQEELRKELAAGTLDQEQFDILILELQHSLLEDVTDSDEASPGKSRKKADKRDRRAATKASPFAGRSWRVPVALLALIPVFAYVAYDEWGYINDVQLMGLFQRTVNNVDDPEEAQRLIVALGEVVQDDDERIWAWYFLAENFAAIGMFNEAEIAYTRAADLLDDIPERALVLGRVAMAMYINAELQFTPEVLEVINQARDINPNEISILQLLASDAAQNQDYQAAIGYWRLMIQASPNSPMAQELRNNIAAAQMFLSQQSPASATGPGIDVSVRLAEGLQLQSNLRVFIAARNADREGLPPLAVTELTVADLPTTIRLDDSSAMVAAFNLSSADQVFVSALASYAGVATPSSGDYRVVSETFVVGEDVASIDLVIAEQIP